MLFYIDPLLTKNEVFFARKAVLSFSNSMSAYKHGNKMHIGSNTLSGYHLIFTSPIFYELSRRVTSRKFLFILNSLASAAANTQFSCKNIKLVPYSPIINPGIDPHLATWCHESAFDQADEKLFIQSCLSRNLIPLKFTIQLSVLPPGSFIQPHTDSVNKLATIMLYLATEEQQKLTGFGTRFWIDNDFSLGSYKSGMTQQASSFVYDQASLDWLSKTRYVDSHFGIGTTVLFFRTDHSWHGVQIPVNHVESRVSININLVLPDIHQNLYHDFFKLTSHG